MSALVSTQALHVHIGNCQVCNNLSFEVLPGQSWGVLGINGVGKTTLLHTLAGLRAPRQGSIQYDNTELGALTRKKIAQHRGILFQDQSDPFPSTVLESVLIGRHPYIEHWQWESAFDIQLARKFIKLLGLTDREHSLINHLSGGERQRVAIAALLTQQVKLLLLDEPTNHLDLRQQVQIMKLFNSLVEDGNCATISIMHDINLAARYCSHILMLFGKGEFLVGTREELLKVDLLEDLYGCPISHLSQNHHNLFFPS